MTRILFLHHVSRIGGGSYCMLALVKAIDRLKFEPVVLLREDGPLADEFRRLGVELHFFSDIVAVPYNQPIWGYGVIPSYIKIEKAQKDFADRIKKLNIDIVYLNNMMLYPYLKIAKKVGCKTIMHVREHWPKNEHKKQMKRARNYALKYADALVAIDHYSASMYPECTDKTTIIYDWIDLSHRNEPKPFFDIFGKNSANLKVMVFTGGLDKIKGTLEVVQTFSNCFKDDSYRLLLMGQGFNYGFCGIFGFFERILMLTGWKPYGYKTMEALKKDNRIVVIPPTYNIVDIFKQAFCTLSYFTIPHANLALAEAIELGTVAVAARTDESYEYSNQGKGAVLFNLNDKEDFVRKIKYVIKNYEKVKTEVERNSETIKKIFDPALNSERLNSVCEKVSKI